MDKKSCSARKPRKPYPTFPLSPHANGKWYIAIPNPGGKPRKRFYYFGRWDDPTAALAEYHAVAADLHAKDQPVRRERVTVAELVDRFLVEAEAKYRSAEIGVAHFDDVRIACQRFRDLIGRDRLVVDLSEHDFQTFRGKMIGGALVRNRHLQWVRTMLRAAYPKLCAEPWHEHRALKKIPERIVRREQREFREKHGKPIFTARECRRLIRAAKPPLRVMILLALNAGMGAKDLADLRVDDIDLARRRIDRNRAKTEVRRQVVLWKITARELAPLLENRRGDDLVFRTRNGHPVVRYVPKLGPRGEVIGTTRMDAVKNHLFRLLKKLDMRRKRRAFYAFRRSFRSAVDGRCRRNAVLRVMGHELPGNDPHYVLSMPWSRIRKVSRAVWRWLNTGKRKAERGDAGAEPSPGPA